MIRRLLFSMDGELGRVAYARVAIPVWLLQHLFTLACLQLAGVRAAIPTLERIRINGVWVEDPRLQTDAAQVAGFMFNPLRALLPLGDTPSLFAAMIVLLMTAWVLAALSFRRARQTGLSGAIGAIALVPFLQPLLIIVLALAPSARAPTHENPAPRPDHRNTRYAVLGAVIGCLICVLAAALSTLVFRTYGVALFMGTPVVVGIAAGYIACQNDDAYDAAPGRVTMIALFLGAATIFGVAIEGAICLLMAAPLIIPLGLLGAAIGEQMAKHRKRKSTLASIAALPLLIMAEAAIPPRTTFVNVSTIEVAAGPDAVWQSITHMGEIDTPPAAPFGWGLAYPIAGEIDGEGVGAVRKGVFSTGIAYERVTVWSPGRELTFDVLSDPPAMRELSPYDEVKAPHLAGYFSTAYAKFTIVPLPGGRSRLSLETQHTLNLDPALYWTPLARLAVEENKRRVLRHFAGQAERAQR